MADPTFKSLASREKIWGATAASVEELTSNRRRTLVDLMRIFLSVRTPIMLWGPFGARKTRTIEALAKEVDENGVPYQVITLQPSTMDPTVIHGLMYTSLDEDGITTVMNRSVPDVASQVVKYWEEHSGLTIMFLDELTTCMPAQQHALLGILTHGKYGDLDISPYISIAMAANPENTVSAVNELGGQFLNRGGHIPWFGDLNLFMEEWRTGFGSVSRAPSSNTDWFISTMLEQSPDKAFRADYDDGRESWTPDTLVPYSMLEHTERTTTELGKMIDPINDLFSQSPDPVRHFYLCEATESLMGKRWRRNMEVTCAMESRRLSADHVINVVNDAGVTSSSTLDEMKAALGDNLYRHRGDPLSQDQISSVSQDLIDTIERANNEQPNKAAILSLWALAITAPDEGVIGSLHGYLIRMTMKNMDHARAGAITKNDATPSFVPDEIRQPIRVALSTRMRG